MSFIEWKESYSIGIPEADEDHRYLVGLINELHETVEQYSRGGTVDAAIRELEAMTSVIDEMLDYASRHFLKEETYMEKSAYPECDEHKQAHRELADKVQTWRREFDEGKAIFSMEIVQFLKDWLDHHILEVDKKLGEFLRGRGVTRFEVIRVESRT